MDEAGKDVVPIEAAGAPAGRTRDGRFAAGNPGKPPGARHRATRMMERILEADAAELAGKAVELAKQGEIAALRLCMERLVPPRRDSPVAFDLPPVVTAGDTQLASSAILAAVAGGDLTAAEAAPIMQMLVAHAGIVEGGDFERRIVALEEGMR